MKAMFGLMFLQIAVWADVAEEHKMDKSDSAVKKYMDNIRKMSIPFEDEFYDVIVPVMTITYYTNLENFLDETEDVQKDIVEKVADAANKFGSYFCLIKDCVKTMSQCVKFDLKIKLNSDAAIKSAASRMVFNQYRRSKKSPRFYDEVTMYNIVNAILESPTTDVSVLLQDKSVPDSLHYVLDANGDGKLTDTEKLIVYFARFMMVAEHISGQIEAVLAVPRQNDLGQFLDGIASFSVSCEQLPISDVFDEQFFTNFDHRTPYKCEIEKLLEKAAKMKAFDTHEYYRLTRAIRMEEHEELLEYLEASRKFFCDKLSCQATEICRYYDHNQLFTLDEESKILNAVINPPARIVMSLDGHYDVKKMYFLMKELLSNHNEQPTKAVVAALDLSADGELDKDEEKLKEFFNDALNFGFLDHTFQVIKNIVDVGTISNVLKMAEENVYCRFQDITDDDLLKKAKESTHLHNIVSMLEKARDMHDSDMLTFDEETDKQESAIEEMTEYTASFETFLCMNFDCNIGGQCKLKDILTSLNESEREIMNHRLAEPPSDIATWMPESLIQNLPYVANKLVTGYYGDFDSIFHAKLDDSLPEKLFAALDSNFDKHLDGHERHLREYIRFIFGKAFIEKSVKILLNAMNAHSESAVDEVLASLTECTCISGFSGRHCESCSVPRLFELLNQPTQQFGNL